MEEMTTIEEAAKKLADTLAVEEPKGLVYNAFKEGAKWALQNQWQKIERDKDGFAIDTSLGEVLIIDDSGEVYVNDDDDYIHDVNYRYWMPIPSLSKELK